jgi:hypothetical protein
LGVANESGRRGFAVANGAGNRFTGAIDLNDQGHLCSVHPDCRACIRGPTDIDADITLRDRPDGSLVALW